MKLLAALLLLCATAAHAQDTVYARGYEAPAEYSVAWNYVVACAGQIADSSTKLEQVHWFERDSSYDSAGNLLIGEWLSPDTIMVTTGFTDSLWVVAHELLHHRLGAYNTTEEPHPWIPFAFPCKLMDFQQSLAGIMGRGRERHAGSAQ